MPCPLQQFADAVLVYRFHVLTWILPYDGPEAAFVERLLARCNQLNRLAKRELIE